MGHSFAILKMKIIKSGLFYCSSLLLSILPFNTFSFPKWWWYLCFYTWKLIIFNCELSLKETSGFWPLIPVGKYMLKKWRCFHYQCSDKSLLYSYESESLVFNLHHFQRIIIQVNKEAELAVHVFPGLPPAPGQPCHGEDR